MYAQQERYMIWTSLVLLIGGAALFVIVPVGATFTQQCNAFKNNAISAVQFFVAPWRNPHIRHGMIIDDKVPTTGFLGFCHRWFTPYLNGGDPKLAALRTGIGLTVYLQVLKYWRTHGKHLGPISIAAGTCLAGISGLLWCNELILPVGNYVTSMYQLQRAYEHNKVYLENLKNSKEKHSLDAVASSLKVCYPITHFVYPETISNYRTFQELLEQNKVPGCSAATETVILGHNSNFSRVPYGNLADKYFEEMNLNIKATPAVVSHQSCVRAYLAEVTGIILKTNVAMCNYSLRAMRAQVKYTVELTKRCPQQKHDCPISQGVSTFMVVREGGPFLPDPILVMMKMMKKLNQRGEILRKTIEWWTVCTELHESGSMCCEMRAVFDLIREQNNKGGNHEDLVARTCDALDNGNKQ